MGQLIIKDANGKVVERAEIEPAKAKALPEKHGPSRLARAIDSIFHPAPPEEGD